MSHAKRTADVMGEQFFVLKNKKTYWQCYHIANSKTTPDQKQELFDWCEAENVTQAQLRGGVPGLVQFCSDLDNLSPRARGRAPDSSWSAAQADTSQSERSPIK